MQISFNNPIWDKARRADLLSKGLYAAGVQAVEDIGANIDESVPRGRVYRRKAIVRVSSKQNRVKGLRMTQRSGKPAVIVGYKFHRASAKGQPPAKDTGKLRRSTKVKRMAAFRVRVFNDAEYAKYLEPPAKLHRPFLANVIVKNQAKYLAIIDKMAIGPMTGR